MKYHLLEDPVFTGGGRRINGGADRPVPLANQPARGGKKITRQRKHFTQFKAQKIREFMQQGREDNPPKHVLRICNTVII